MDIVYSSSDSYCEIAGISMLSLLEHNKKVEELNLYLIDNNISEKQDTLGADDSRVWKNTDISRSSGY